MTFQLTPLYQQKTLYWLLQKQSCIFLLNERQNHILWVQTKYGPTLTRPLKLFSPYFGAVAYTYGICSTVHFFGPRTVGWKRCTWPRYICTRTSKTLISSFLYTIHPPFNHHQIISILNWWLLNGGGVLRQVLRLRPEKRALLSFFFLWVSCVSGPFKKTPPSQMCSKTFEMRASGSGSREKKQHGATNVRLAAGFSTFAIRAATRWQQRPSKEDQITGATNSESPTSGGSANEALSSAGQIQTETGWNGHTCETKLDTRKEII